MPCSLLQSRRSKNIDDRNIERRARTARGCVGGNHASFPYRSSQSTVARKTSLRAGAPSYSFSAMRGAKRQHCTSQHRISLIGSGHAERRRAGRKRDRAYPAAGEGSQAGCLCQDHRLPLAGTRRWFSFLQARHQHAVPHVKILPVLPPQRMVKKRFRQRWPDGRQKLNTLKPVSGSVGLDGDLIMWAEGCSATAANALCITSGFRPACTLSRFTSASICSYSAGCGLAFSTVKGSLIVSFVCGCTVISSDQGFRRSPVRFS